MVRPLDPRTTGDLVGARSAAESFDAYLVTGGLPLICNEWPTGTPLWDYLTDALSRPTSALIVSGERTLSAEFPDDAQARLVLQQIGHGETTFSNIARAGGVLQATPLSRSLDILTTKRVVTKALPLSTKASREARYYVSDPYLRFWLHFVGPYLPEIERGRGDRVANRIRDNWQTWCGRAIEPVVRESLSLLSPITGLAEAPEVGGYWTRNNTPKVDLVGADRGPVAKEIVYAGSIKWHENKVFDQADWNRLAADALKIPGADTGTALVSVCRSGFAGKSGQIQLEPNDLLDAWL